MTNFDRAEIRRLIRESEVFSFCHKFLYWKNDSSTVTPGAINTQSTTTVKMDYLYCLSGTVAVFFLRHQMVPPDALKAGYFAHFCETSRTSV